MLKTYSISVSTPVDKCSLSGIFKSMRDSGVSEVLELGVAVVSCGEFSTDFRTVFIPVDGSQTHEEMRREIAKTQCASDWVVVIRKTHQLRGSGVMGFLRHATRSLAFTN